MPSGKKSVLNPVAAKPAIERLKFFIRKDHTDKTIPQLQTQTETTSTTQRFESTVRLIIRFLATDSQEGVD